MSQGHLYHYKSVIKAADELAYLDGRLLVDALVLEVLALLQYLGGLLELGRAGQVGRHLLLGPVQPGYQIPHLRPHTTTSTAFCRMLLVSHPH